MQLSIVQRGLTRMLLSVLLAFFPSEWVHAQSADEQAALATSNKPIVFLIVLENKNWVGTGGISGSSEAPYINKTLVPMAAVANNYFNPSGNHPSLPNYLWMEAGQNFGIYTDGVPTSYDLTTHAHLAELLQNAGIPWRAYAESISGTVCPLWPEGAYDANGGRLYQPRHLPFVYFSDMTSGKNLHSSYCIQHVRPLSELGSNLKYNTIGRYNFIAPNLCHDGHDSCGGNEIAHIDEWLRSFLPQIFNSAQYKEGHVVLFIATDEAKNGDGPIPFLALGHGVKRGYKNEIRYTHSALLRTLEEILGVSPGLGHAAYSNDLRDLFSAFP
ncbi:MAG: alkaline phosphatase family protein [Acidobacteriaceae bacterium]